MRDTPHLSMLEDAAYRRLLDFYYSTERPLPDDLAKLCGIARAATKDEREAVRTVMEQFFPKGPDGRRNKRADAEISRAKRISGLRSEAAHAKHLHSKSTAIAMQTGSGSKKFLKAVPEVHANAVQMQKSPWGNCGNCGKPLLGGWTNSPKGRACMPCYRGYMGGAWPQSEAA